MAANNSKLVISCRDFCEKYGTDGASLLVGEFLLKSPDFPGSLELASKLGIMMADLQSALELDPLC